MVGNPVLIPRATTDKTLFQSRKRDLMVGNLDSHVLAVYPDRFQSRKRDLMVGNFWEDLEDVEED